MVGPIGVHYSKESLHCNLGSQVENIRLGACEHYYNKEIYTWPEFLIFMKIYSHKNNLKSQEGVHVHVQIWKVVQRHMQACCRNNL